MTPEYPPRVLTADMRELERTRRRLRIAAAGKDKRKGARR